MRKHAVTIILLALLFGADQAAGASACRVPRGATPVANTRQAVLFAQAVDEETTAYRGCARPSGDVMTLAVQGAPDPYLEEHLTRFRLVGSFVSWVSTSSTRDGSSSADVNVADLSGAHPTRRSTVGYGDENSQSGPLRPIGVPTVRLDAAGRSVWLQRTTAIDTGRTVDSIVTSTSTGAPRLLAEASPGHLPALALRAGRARWRQDGRVHTRAVARPRPHRTRFVAARLPTARSRAATCALPHDATLVRITPAAVLYRRPTDSDGRADAPASVYQLVGCLRATNHRRVIEGYLGEDAVYGDITIRRPTAIRTAGRFVALVVANEEPRYDQQSSSLQVYDLRTGRASGAITVDDRHADTVRGLQLSANGRVTITITGASAPPGGGAQRGLWTLQSGGLVPLELGAGPFTNVAFTKRGIRWVSPTGRHTAAVEPALP